jgi:aspartate/methionine/tyrosine aminotransferase
MGIKISDFANELIAETSPISEIFKFADVSKLQEFGIKESEFVSFCGGWVNHTSPPQLEASYLKIIKDKESFHFTGGYSPTTGELRLKKALIRFSENLYRTSNLTTQEIAIGQSSSHLTLALFHVLLNKEDKIALLDPTFLTYPFQIKATADCQILRYPVFDRQNYAYIANERERIADFSSFLLKNKPKIVLLVSPDNPSSQVLSHEFVNSCYQTVKSYGGLIIVDFAYKEITFNDCPEYYGWRPDENFITIHSNSKWCRGLGRRLGWIEAPENVIEAIEALQTVSILCPDRLHQIALADYIEQSLKDDSLKNYIQQTRALYAETAKVTIDAMEKYIKLPFITPEGGLYICMKVGIDGADFIERVFKYTGVLFVAGNAFGPSMSDSIRLSYGPLVYNHASITDGLKRVGEYLKNAGNESFPETFSLLRRF